MHLRPDELVDLAERTRDESDVPHLRSCASCRKQLDELRATMSMAAAVDAPEPSPLFWEHLSSRIHDAAAAGPAPRAHGWSIAASWRFWSVPVALTAAVIVAVAIVPRGPVRAPAHSPLRPDAAYALDSLPDDPALNLVADLASTMTYDEASEIAAGGHAGSIDEAVGSLSAAERQELHRLLDEAMR
jgi:hypothetical protein